MTGVPPGVGEWVARVRPGAQVTDVTVRPLTGGAVAQRVEQLTLHLTGDQEPLRLVGKDAPVLEVAGLRAAQAVRPEATAIPELVASGDGWLITPLAPGSALAAGAEVPAGLFDSLARLHVRFLGDAGLAAAIPRVTPAWWRSLCLDWVEPQLGPQADRHPPGLMDRARDLVRRAAELPAAAAVLAELPATLLHGDVHPGNVVVDGDRATLIDWGSSRIGPAALDLANLVAADSAGVARYARTWRQLTGEPVPAATIGLGYRWAALQIPVQYLAWVAGNRPAPDVGTALDQIERAIGRLSAENGI